MKPKKHMKHKVLCKVALNEAIKAVKLQYILDIIELERLKNDPNRLQAKPIRKD